MKKEKVSIVISVYKPNPEVFEMQRKMLEKQTLKSEIIRVENLPEAISLNTGIRKAKGEIIVTLTADCVPERTDWLEKLIEPLNDRKVVVVVSDLILPKWYWKKYPFITRMLTMKDLGIRRPLMDARACAFRKKDLEKVGLFNENPKVVAIDRDLYDKIKHMGKIVHPNLNALHLHPLTNIKKLKLDYKYAKICGNTIANFKPNDSIFWIRVIRAIPLIGIVGIILRFPFKDYWYYFPLYVLFSPIQHVMYLLGFWKGFFSG